MASIQPISLTDAMDLLRIDPRIQTSSPKSSMPSATE